MKQTNKRTLTRARVVVSLALSVEEGTGLQEVLRSLVRFSTVTESRWFDANAHEVAFESAVGCSEAENGCLFVASQLVGGRLAAD